MLDCSNHAGIAARWSCDTCARNYCDTCVVAKVFCRDCGVRCRTVKGAPHQAPRPNPNRKRPTYWPLVVTILLVVTTLGGACVIQQRARRAYIDSEMERQLQRAMAARTEQSRPEDRVRTGRVYDWQVVERTTVERRVFMDAPGYEDYCAFADALERVRATTYGGRTMRIHFYDDRALTPASLRASYVYSQADGGEKFYWIEGKHKQSARIPQVCP